jgi:hypothetical protein
MQAESTAAQQLLSYFSNPCFSQKMVNNYGLWVKFQHPSAPLGMAGTADELRTTYFS